VKPVKTGSFIVQAARYLGALTRCKSKVFETCTKRAARQSGFGSWPVGKAFKRRPLMFHFTNSSPIILVSISPIPPAALKPARKTREFP
jgi:hypothetical protein